MFLLFLNRLFCSVMFVSEKERLFHRKSVQWLQYNSILVYMACQCMHMHGKLWHAIYMAGTGMPVLKILLIFHHFYFILLGSWSPGLSTSWVWILPSCPSSSLHTRTQVWQCSGGNASWEGHEAPSSSGLYKHFPKTCSHIFRCTFPWGFFLQAVNS